MRDLLPASHPALVLAPMQDITDLPFMRVLSRRSHPTWFVTAYFRVHPASNLNPSLLRSITENNSGRPVFAQLIGRDLPSLVRTARELSRYPIAGIDLNLGCPAPIVCRKDAGGGLLRDPQGMNRLLEGLREAIPGRFTVKTRVGYHDASEFTRLLEIFRSHAIDGLTLHARTVIDGYHGPIHPAWVRAAVASLPCPVIANGNIVDALTGLACHRQTAAAGLMIGRGAIRNPWIFEHLQAAFEGRTQQKPTSMDLLEYIRDLYDEIAREAVNFDPLGHVQRMKRTMGYISHGHEPDFEHQIRRCTTPSEFWSICHDHLDNDKPLPTRPPESSNLYSGFAEWDK